MIHNPKTGEPIMATVYLVGAIRVTLCDATGRLVALEAVSPVGCPFTHYREAYLKHCVVEAQAKHRARMIEHEG